MGFEADLTQLAEQFADRVVEAAALPAVRRVDLIESCELAVEPPLLSLTCTITGSTYVREWDGSQVEALRLIEEAAEGTAFLIAGTRHYAWLQSRP